MFKKLRNAFQDIFGHPTHGISPPIPHPDPIGAVRWLDANDPKNPFGVRIIDCSSSAMGLLSVSQDPKIAESYGRLRSDDGRRHLGMRPPDPIAAECDLQYPVTGSISDGPLHTSREMEDKWDIYLYSGHLYFSRSWGGNLEFVAHVDVAPERAIVGSVSARRDIALGNATLAVRQVDFLVKRLLLRWATPAPLPFHLPIDDTETVAMYLFSTYGRAALSGTYEDTLPLGR